MDNLLILCRVCLSKGEISIFREACFKDSIRDRLMACASIRVDLNDGFPSNICTQCLSELDNAYNFRLKCERSEKKLVECFGLFTNTLDNENNNEDDTMDSTTVQCDNKDEVLECVESIKREGDQDSYAVLEQVESIKREGDKESYEVNISRNLKSEPTCSQSEHPKTLQNGGKILKLKRKMNEKLHRQKRTRDRKCKVTQSTDNRVYMEKPKERDKTRKHMCTICGKTFLFHGNLLDHERVHSGDKPYSCNICNRRFAQSGHLMVHARTHTGDKPYQCEVCPRAFTVSHALKKHLRTHTGERPYPCTLCDKSFVTSYHLSNHFKRHMGDKRFKCDWPDCQQGFVNVSEMKRHRARHEKIKVSPKNKNTCDRLQSIPIIDLQIIPANISGSINPYNDFRRCYESIF